MRSLHRRAALPLAVLAAPLAPAIASPGAEPVRIFVVAGQSNAVGAGAAASQLPTELLAPQRDVRFWFEIGPADGVHDLAMRVSSGGKFVPLAHQTDASARTFGGAIDGFGPELRLGRALADSQGDDVAIVKFAFNGSSLASDWNSDIPGSLYGQMIRRVRLARTSLELAGHPTSIGGVLWMQGESDAASSDDAWLYAERLTKLITRARADLGHPTLPFVIGRVDAHIDSAEGYSLPYVNVIRQQQQFVATNVPYTSLVDTDDLTLTADHLHFDWKGELDLGLRFASEYLASASTGPASPFCFAGRACPCGNATLGSLRAGCANSHALGGKLLAVGTARKSDDRLQLALSGIPATSVVQFIEQDAQSGGGVGTAMGDGLRCLSGHLVRLGVKAGNATYPGASDVPIGIRGMASAGRTLYYQALYRDGASYCTPSLSNSTNALAITWQP